MSIDTFLLSADTTDLDYPEVRPTLDLNFARVKALDPRITFTRASGGSYVGADGLIKYAGVNEARFDHDPETGESLGLLVEESRTNLLRRSEEFETAWIPTNVTISADAIIAPNGTLTADKLVETIDNGVHATSQGTVTSGLAYVFSVYAKAGERTRMQISGLGAEGQGFFTDYNLSTGIVSSAPPGSQMIAVGNGWYRCTLVITASATVGVVIRIRDASGNNIYTGDVTKGIYLWGAQLEQGSFPTSYIPTEGSTRTRAADIASITGKNFSEWYRQGEGSFFCSTFAPKGIVLFGTGDTFGNTQYVTVASSFYVTIRSGGVSVASLAAPVSTTALTNIAHGYAANNFAAVSNGGATSTDTTGAVPLAQVRLKLGSSAWNTGGLNNLNGPIRRLTYYPKRLSNSQLQALTR